MRWASFWRANVVLGPYAGFRVSQNTPFDGELKRVELGVAVGAGVVLPLGPGSVTLDLRYEQGLTSVKSTAAIHNRAFMILLGYALR
jgi:hypothetical protein